LRNARRAALQQRGVRPKRDLAHFARVDLVDSGSRPAALSNCTFVFTPA